MLAVKGDYSYIRDLVLNALQCFVLAVVVVADVTVDTIFVCMFLFHFLIIMVVVAVLFSDYKPY